MASAAGDRTLPHGDERNLRYSAFISYNQADARFVRRLHRQLETYRVPHRLAQAVDRELARGRRLKPLFRDIDELSAAPDLTAAVREALAESDYLIVVCSPNSAKSKWVGREIELFRSLHGDARILTALIDGTTENALHPALRREVDGQVLGPLAADFRPKTGNGRLALLKLLAPMAGVHLDDLVHRDGQRRLRQMVVGGASVAATITLLAFAGLVALSERGAANNERSRGQALVESMLSVRKSLKSAGQPIDVQASVTNGALPQYCSLDIAQLADKPLQLCASGLHDRGELEEKSGDLPSARQDFIQARRMTTARLATKPRDPQRIFDQAQSEYWVGFSSWRSDDAVAAQAGFDAYARLANELVRIDANNAAWVKEVAYAANNLGMLALRHAGDPDTAERNFRRKLAALDRVGELSPGDKDTLKSTANTFAWIADCQRIRGDFAAALASRAREAEIYRRLLADNPQNIDVQANLIGNALAVARIEAAQGQSRRAIATLEDGRKRILALQPSDRVNADLLKQARMFELFKVRTWLDLPSRSRPPATAIRDALGDCSPRTSALANREIEDFCAVLRARWLAASGDATAAQTDLAAVRRRLSEQHNALTAHWGLDLAAEARTVEDELAKRRAG